LFNWPSFLTPCGRHFTFEAMPYDAFISYASLDKARADATCAALEASGIRCWIAPRDIVPGAEWGEAIILAINQCRVVILIFSANANESPQIRREVERAVSKGIPIIPFRIQDIAPNHSLEYFIGTVHWLDALTPPLEAHLRRLAEFPSSDRSHAPTHHSVRWSRTACGSIRLAEPADPGGGIDRMLGHGRGRRFSIAVWRDAGATASAGFISGAPHAGFRSTTGPDARRSVEGCHRSAPDRGFRSRQHE
jgi:hypothetical protein